MTDYVPWSTLMEQAWETEVDPFVFWLKVYKKNVLSHLIWNLHFNAFFLKAKELYTCE